VERREDECEPTPSHGYCYFGAASVEWETAMGINYEENFDDVLRGPPAIVGPIVYGEHRPTPKACTSASWSNGCALASSTRGASAR
jgi:hypothetical protein